MHCIILLPEGLSEPGFGQGVYLRFWLSIPLKDETKPFFTETLEIIQAIESKQEDMLKSATLEHLKRSVDNIMGTF